ncbi:YecA family protein [Euzebya rosea]|uniref:YecA family protein n=1 Tax=Euzebya rosea TaxID=2052804 RepID=UPI0023E8E904|nr:SEC-C metal-binding domain-containing protein [Euzebya rosea]
MNDLTADLPADLVDRLAEVPRDEPMVLDLVGPVDVGGTPTEVRLRILAADPLEGDRQGADRFVAAHPTPDGREVIGYVSLGQAELDAADAGWAALLGRAARAVAEAMAGSDGATGAAHGEDPLADLPAEPAPIDGWQVGEWLPYSVGVLIDIAEAEDGPLGFPAEPLVPTTPPKRIDDCAGCAGTVLHPPHIPLEVVLGLCPTHQRQHESWIADHLPMAEEELHTLHSLIIDMEAVYVSGVGAGIAAIDRGESTPTELLRRARTWFDEPGRLSPVYIDDDDLAGVLERATQDIKEAEGVEAGLAALDDLRFLVPEACWLVDMDALVWLEQDDPRQRQLLDHVLADHADEPGAILGAAEMHERLDDHETATALYRRAWTRGLASGQPMIAEVAEQGLERIGEEPPQPTSKVGRNDPCPCGSGKKFKKCCGR